MISLCIPIYNCDVRKLVKDLSKQAEETNVDFEILLIDDASDIIFKDKNKEIAGIRGVNYQELPENIGRSAIRNMLAHKAKYKYLLFMDCDAEVITDSFIAGYLSYCKPNVVCCGRVKSGDRAFAPEYLLRWCYGVKREDIEAKRRNITGGHFSAFHFLVDRELFINIAFDERIKKYGHEDTLFGMELQKKRIKIVHTDNPLLHTGIDRSIEFIEKTEQGIRNLIDIQNYVDDKDYFTHYVKLLNTESKIQRLHLSGVISYFFRKTKKLILSNLYGTSPNLFLFDIYKLGFICLQREQYEKVR